MHNIYGVLCKRTLYAEYLVWRIAITKFAQQLFHYIWYVVRVSPYMRVKVHIQSLVVVLGKI